MNALVANRVMCAEPGDCCQPGTVNVPVLVAADAYHEVVVDLEFCVRHAARRLDVEERLLAGARQR